MRHCCGRRVERLALCEQRHLGVTGGDRLATHCRITEHHPRDRAREERAYVVEILLIPDLVHLDTLPLRRGRSESRHGVVMAGNTGGLIAELWCHLHQSCQASRQ